jgi:hypothetical protein
VYFLLPLAKLLILTKEPKKKDDGWKDEGGCVFSSYFRLLLRLTDWAQLCIPTLQFCHGSPFLAASLSSMFSSGASPATKINTFSRIRYFKKGLCDKISGHISVELWAKSFVYIMTLLQWIVSLINLLIDADPQQC